MSNIQERMNMDRAEQQEIVRKALNEFINSTGFKPIDLTLEKVNLDRSDESTIQELRFSYSSENRTGYKEPAVIPEIIHRIHIRAI